MWDFSLPGYKYLGPGNKLNKGKPRNYNDAVAKKHDMEYDSILKKRKNPYTNWNSADERFMKKIKLSDYGGIAGYGFFGLKRTAARAGFIGTLESVSTKKLRFAGPNDKKSTTVVNLPSGETMADGGGSGNDVGLKEAPVDDPYVVYRGPPDYIFASLPYSETVQFDRTTTSALDNVFRMTSVYDCRHDVQSNDINVGGGLQYVDSEFESGQSKARWFDYYSTLYKYYHVVGCRYHIRIENLGGDPIWAYALFYNDDYPDASATNEDMQLWTGVKYHLLDRRYLAIQAAGTIETGDVGGSNFSEGMVGATTLAPYETGNHVSTNKSGSCVFSGEYKTGDYRREIRLDSQVENWTAISTNPDLPEKLMIRVKPTNERYVNNAPTSGGDDLKFLMEGMDLERREGRVASQDLTGARTLDHLRGRRKIRK